MGYIAYYRVSTKQQGDSGLGIEAQRAIICHYYPCETFVGEFTEVGSGKDVENRPLLQQAMSECLEGGHTLVVAKIDRLSRKTEDALSIYTTLGGRLISCDIPNLDKFTLTIFMAIADRERELIGIRTKAALKAKRNRGEVLGNPQYLSQAGRDMGAQTMRKKAVAAYDDLLVDTIISKRARGLTYQDIAQYLNEKNQTTRQGKAFKPMTVKRIYDRAMG